MGESMERLENLVRLLRTLSDEEIAAVWRFVEGLVQHRAELRETQAPYIAPVKTAEEMIHRTPPRGSRDALIECLGIWAFDPGELDPILADIEQVR